MMKRVDRVLRAWCERHPTRNPPASPEQLQVLSQVLDIVLPDDVVAFYTVCNGVPEGESDDHFVSFWSIEKIRRESTLWPCARGIGFADFLINSWSFQLLVDEGRVQVWFDGADERIDSFSNFLERYVERPESFPIL